MPTRMENLIFAQVMLEQLRRDLEGEGEDC